MKKAIQLLAAITALLFLSAQPAKAQLLKKIQDKVNKKIENRIDQEADEQIDKTLDQVFEGDSTSEQTNDDSSDLSDQQRMSNIMKGLGMSGEPVPIADSYHFQSKIQMHIESYDDKGKLESDGEFITWVSPSMKNFAYEFVSGNIARDGKGLIIMDVENNAMIILSEEDSKKTGIVYGFNPDAFSSWSDSLADYDDYEPANVNLNPYLEKTGQTKTISGYSCDEYHYNNPEEDTEANFWLSKEADFSTKDMISSIFKTASYSNGMPWGFIMESESWNKNTKERNLMKVTEINKNANTRFNLSDYQITNLGSMNIPAGN